MSAKRKPKVIKAWAVCTLTGKIICPFPGSHALIFREKRSADWENRFNIQEVRRVTITVEPKK